jgi:hypothetical protein
MVPGVHLLACKPTSRKNIFNILTKHVTQNNKAVVTARKAAHDILQPKNACVISDSLFISIKKPRQHKNMA